MSKKSKRRRNQLAQPMLAAVADSSTLTGLPGNGGKVDETKVDTRVRAFPDWETAYKSIGQPRKVWSYGGSRSTDFYCVFRDDRPERTTVLQVIYRDQHGWTLGLPPSPYVLYQRDELSDEETVLVCETEDATDAARMLCCAATTPLGGFSMAADSDWSPLKGKHVAIIPRVDDRAIAAAKQVAELVLDAGALSAKIVSLPGLKPGQDFSYWVFEYGSDDDEFDSLEELQKLIRSAPTVRPAAKLRSLATVEPERLEWVWEGVIPRGKLTLIVGEAGIGKSLFAVDVAARVTRGELEPFHDARSALVTCAENGPPGAVILFSASEDLADLVRPRLDAAGADVSRIYPMDLVCPIDEDRDPQPQNESPNSDLQPFDLQTDISILENELQRLNDAGLSVRLIVIDPISRYLDPAGGLQAAAIRKVAHQLAQLAARFRTAIVLVGSDQNCAAGRPGNWAATTQAVASVAQSVWMIVRDVKQTQRRMLLPLKMNLSDTVYGLGFSMNAGVVEWEETELRLNGEELPRLTEIDPNSKPGGELNRAMNWLSERLAKGPVFSAEIMSEAESNQISETTLRRAYYRLGCKSARNIGCDHWHWIFHARQ